MFLKPFIKRERIDAFTLVELLVGISIFSIIALSLYSTFANAIRLHKKSQNVEDFYRDIRWSISSLSQDLVNAVPFSYFKRQVHIQETRVNGPSSGNVPVTIRELDDDSGEEVQGFLSGNEFSLSFLLSRPSGPTVVRYYLESPQELDIFKTIVGGVSQAPRALKVYLDEGASPVQFLVREESPLFGGGLEEVPATSDKEILSLNILKDSLKFSYAEINKENPSGGIDWKNEWHEKDYPVGVRMELVFVDPEDQDKQLNIRKDIFIPRGEWAWLKN